MARERRHKNRMIAFLVRRNHKNARRVGRNLLIAIVHDILSYDRAWRWWLEDKNRPDLRGKDYNGRGFKKKNQLDQETQVQLNYESGYNMKLKV